MDDILEFHTIADVKKALIENSDQVIEEKISILLNAIQNNNIEVFDFVLHNVSRDSMSIQNISLIVPVLQNRYYDILDSMIDYGFEFNVFTVFFIAYNFDKELNGDLELLKNLEKRGFDTDLVKSELVKKNIPEVYEYIIERFGDVEIENDSNLWDTYTDAVMQVYDKVKRENISI